VLAAALWMPFSRFFYIAGAVMMVYPLLLYAHALLFKGRAAWRAAWYAAPLLLGGCVLCFYSLSFIRTYANGWRWEFIPAFGQSAIVRSMDLQVQEKSLSEAIRLKGVATAKNFGQVLQYMTYRGGLNEWYRRADSETHPTITNVAFVVLLAVSLGYLLAQLYD